MCDDERDIRSYFDYSLVGNRVRDLITMKKRNTSINVQQNESMKKHNMHTPQRTL